MHVYDMCTLPSSGSRGKARVFSTWAGAQRALRGREWASHPLAKWGLLRRAKRVGEEVTTRLTTPHLRLRGTPPPT